MKILKVIHGYPMRYNAGSEVYSQTLCHGLADRNQVKVFSRIEDSFSPDYTLFSEKDIDRPDIDIHLVNMPRAKDGYRHQGVDDQFEKVLNEFQPDIVHVGHLNHLSTSIPLVAKRSNIPVVYTLHDYWLMCPRGQFMQMFPESPKDPEQLWADCNGQENKKCALRCYLRYFSGLPEDYQYDLSHWEKWVDRRMNHIHQVCQAVDLFIAPARYLYKRYHEHFGIQKKKMVYLDYGFDLSRLANHCRISNEPFTFGYIGTHIPAKGIHHLLEAFGKLSGSPQLRIWGRPRSQDTQSLMGIADRLPNNAGTRVQWIAEYKNKDIIHDVFNRVDAIVVPSIWAENSPLVIHEALQARVPVVTANAGGMCEYIHHEKNGLLFDHRSPEMMAQQMQRLVDTPGLSVKLGKQGYLQSDTKNIPDIESHVLAIEKLYEKVLTQTSTQTATGPWRITFDTNPDICNLNCIMCEEHSPFRKKPAGAPVKNRPQRKMPVELIEKIIKEMAPMGLKEIIPSTMGEPLLYRHFDRIIELCHEYKLSLNLTTNGTFPGRSVEEWAHLIAPVCSDIKISWNGSTKEIQETIMRNSNFNRMRKNLRHFLAIRDHTHKNTGHYCRVTLQITFMKNNLEDLPNIVDMAVDFGVDRLKGHHLWVHFPETEHLSLRRNAGTIKEWNTVVEIIKQKVKEKHLPNGKMLLLENIHTMNPEQPGLLIENSECPFLGKEAWINTEGWFSPCCAPDKLRKKLGRFGSVQKNSFAEIWNSHEYNTLQTDYNTYSLCRSCNMRRKMEA